MKQDNFITEDEYLKGELVSEVKHEYVNGQVYAMAGGTAEHVTISGNVFGEIWQFLKGNKDRKCKVYQSDMMIKAANNDFYPDVVVICDDHQDDTKTRKFSPKIIVEVLSDSTRKKDRTVKLISYINTTSVEEYILVEQDKCEIEVLRRRNGWIPQFYFLGDDIKFESIDLTISIEDIYDLIENNDMTKYLESKNKS